MSVRPAVSQFVAVIAPNIVIKSHFLDLTLAS
ncbi:MAG: hypothetical protein ACI8VI_000429, partial [Granulosicoccus sp.]